jgi:hypothetical protein
VLSVTVYYLFEYGQFQAIPVLESFLDLVFSVLPTWMETLYIVTSGLYLLGSSIHDSMTT